MTLTIQGQKNWNEFETSGEVGIITTLFSEQLLTACYNVTPLSPDNYEEEIGIKNIDTVFIDNDIFEKDHIWYSANRGHIINYLKNTEVNICVIQNTTKDIRQIFKKAFLLKINPRITEYIYNDYLIEIPILIDALEINPINTHKETDIAYLELQDEDTSLKEQNYNQERSLKVNNLMGLEVSKQTFYELIEHIKKCRILYLKNLSYLDEVTVKYIEYISVLSTTYVVYDHKFDLDSPLFENEDIYSLNNKISILLRNHDYLLKNLVVKQRDILINHTFLLKQSFEEFRKTRKNIKRTPEVSIITSTKRRANLENYFEQISHQKLVNLEVNMTTHGFSLSKDEKIRLTEGLAFKVNFHQAETNEKLGSCLNRSLETCTFPVITKMDDDDFYLEHYLIDQWLAIEYSRADTVGKLEGYYFFEDMNIIAKRNKGDYFKFGDFIMGATIMAKAEVMKNLQFKDLDISEDTDFIKRLLEGGGTVYVNHPFDFCVFRSRETDKHSWKVNDLAMLKKAEIVGYGNPVPYVQTTSKNLL